MKLKHNKKRNTAFVFEVLINEVSKASMHDQSKRKQSTLNIIKKYFYKGSVLKEELEIYKSFDGLESSPPDLVEKIIAESKSHIKALDSETVYDQQTKLINEANKTLGPEIWNNFVSNYKKLATVNQVLNGAQNPKKQVFIEQKLVGMLTQQEKIQKQPFPAVNKLALKTFLGKFNDKYSDSLSESQKRLLKEYITSYKDNGVELDMFLYEEITRLKEQLTERIQNSDKAEKLTLVLEKIQSYQNKKIDRKAISEIIKIQSLVSELNNAN
jgi:hypothetical protein